MGKMQEAAKPKVCIGHVISDQSPEQFRVLLDKFCSNPEYRIIQKHISTTAVMVGMQALGNGRGQANMVIVASAYIEFECTEEAAKQFHLHQSLLVK